MALSITLAATIRAHIKKVGPSRLMFAGTRAKKVMLSAWMKLLHIKFW